MRKSNIWSLALATFAVSGAVAASALAPAITRAEEGEVPEVKYVLDPESGASVYDLQTINISFPDNKNIQVNERMILNSIVLTNTETGEEYYCDSPLRADRATEGTSFILNFLTPGAEEGEEAELKPITDLGTYDLTITQGIFIYGDEVEGEDGSTSLENVYPVQAINATYTVVEAAPAVAYTLDPEDGAIVNDLQTITISFEDRNVMPNDRMEFNAIVLTDANGNEYYCDAPMRDSRAQGAAYTLTFLTEVENENGVESVAAPITAPGEYKLSILKGTFIRADEVEGEDGTVTLENVVPVEAINATYTVAEAAPAVAYTLEPEDGAIVNDLQTITISFEDVNVQFNERMELNAIVLTAENGEEYYCDAPVRDTRVAQGVAYTLNFLTSVETEAGVESELKPINVPGEYKLSILKGTFIRADEVEGEDGTVTLENVVPVEAINATYTVVAPDAEFAYVLDPEDGAIVEDLQTVMINFTETTNIQYNFMEFDAIMLTNTETGKVYYCDGPDRVSRVQSGIAFSLNFLTAVESDYGVDYVLDPITEPGTYRLSIRKGAFLAADEVEDEEGNITSENIVPVQEIIATYTISNTTGVNGIFGADATEFNVYGVNGVQILKSADRNAINALPAGLYIINGKKVIKK